MSTPRRAIDSIVDGCGYEMCYSIYDDGEQEPTKDEAKEALETLKAEVDAALAMLEQSEDEVRSQFAFNISRGTGSMKKVQRYLRASGLDAPVFVTEAMRQRHIHPRSLRGKLTGEVPGQSTLAADTRTSTSASGRGQPVNTSPFASLGKKPDAPAS